MNSRAKHAKRKRALARSPKTRIPGLPDATLAELHDIAGALDENYIATNTERSYDSDWKTWVEFCSRHEINPLPAEVGDVRLYLTQLAAVGGRKGAKLRPKSAQRHLATIAAMHHEKGYTFNARHPVLMRTLKSMFRSFGARAEGAPALRRADIVAICATFSSDLRDVRDKAIILLGFAGAFRRSEIVALNVNDLEFKDGVLHVIVRRSKTDQEGEGRTVAIMPGIAQATCAVAAVRAWFKEADIKLEGDNPVFRGVGKRGAEFGRLSDRMVDRIVKSACRAARLKENYSAHSLRAGHVTEALANGADRAAIKRQTGHRSDAMLDRYARETNLAANNSSSSLGL